MGFGNECGILLDSPLCLLHPAACSSWIPSIHEISLASALPRRNSLFLRQCHCWWNLSTTYRHGFKTCPELNTLPQTPQYGEKQISKQILPVVSSNGWSSTCRLDRAGQCLVFNRSKAFPYPFPAAQCLHHLVQRFKELTLTTPSCLCSSGLYQSRRPPTISIEGRNRARSLLHPRSFSHSRSRASRRFTYHPKESRSISPPR